MTAGQSPPSRRETVSRRDFLRVGSLTVVGLSVAEQKALARERDRAARRSCILVLMTGGPSQLETFDPKPDAPPYIRGPLRAISTAVPGVVLSESLPHLAERAGRFTLVRSLCHHGAAIHETGLQLLQTGRLTNGGLRYPAFGSVVASRLGTRGEAPPYVVLPRLIGNTGVSAYCGQQAGCLGGEFDPLTAVAEGGAAEISLDENDDSITAIPVAGEPDSIRRAYGETRFGRLLLQARKLVECGVRCVTVNLFDRLANQLTWDCHGRGPWAPATLYDYRDTLCPHFDRALSALLDDLAERGLLDDTLVVATGEFGRTPHINAHGGRDHWPGVWSAFVAGAGTPGGQVIGRSDRSATAPVDRPIDPAELTATIYLRLGLDPASPLPLPEPAAAPLVAHQPIAELIES